MRILLDTNFLLIPAQFKIDVFEELKRFGEPLTISVCVIELKKLSRKKGKPGEHARIALLLLKKKKIKIVKAKGEADFALMNHAKKFNCAVATNDRKLIKALKNNGIKIIRMRQKKYLIMV